MNILSTIKSNIFLTFFFLTSVAIYCDEKPTFDHSLSLGNTTANFIYKDLFFTGDVIKYCITESNTGLKASLYLLSLDLVDGLSITEFFKNTKPLGFEVAWEPLYKNKSTVGFEASFRIDSLLNKDPLEDWRSGLVINCRILDDQTSFNYPVVSAEFGYWNGKGIYGALKVDILIGLGGSLYSYLEGLYEDSIPEKY